MERPLMTTHDALTEITEVREMTDEEIAQYAKQEVETLTDEAPASDDAGVPSTDAG